MLNVGGFVPHKKFLDFFSTFENISNVGEGRDSRMCTNFDVNKLFIIVILPIGVSSLGVQISIYLFISWILFSIIISVILFNLFTLKVIPKKVGHNGYHVDLLS